MILGIGIFLCVASTVCWLPVLAHFYLGYRNREKKNPISLAIIGQSIASLYLGPAFFFTALSGVDQLVVAIVFLALNTLVAIGFIVTFQAAKGLPEQRRD